MLKRYLLFPALAALALSAPLAAHADDQVRSAQEALKTQGYYDGPVDGELNADTKGAIRRYQIRNGLDATGELNQATLTSINGAGATGTQTAPAPQATPEPFHQTTPPPPAPAAPEPAAPAPQPAPEAGYPPAPVRPAPPSAAGDPAFSRLYFHTPYETAPAEVQQDTLRKAQKLLAHHGLYRGEPNGLPGPGTEEALIRFQSAEHLPRTGALDIDTLARLHLLPVARVIRPHEPEAHIPRGYAPDKGPAAVRGIPAD